MSTEALQLTPIQASILDVYRRLSVVGLGASATFDVVAVHAKVNNTKARSVAAELVELGLLAKGDEGRTKRSLVLTDLGRAYLPPPMQQSA